MNNEKAADNPTVSMEEKIDQSHDDTKVPEHEAIKSEISNWIDIKGISDKSDDLNNLKTEKNGMSVKEDHDDTVEEKADRREKLEVIESNKDNELKSPCIDEETIENKKVKDESAESLQSQVATKIGVNVKPDEKAGKSETIQLIEETIVIPAIAGQATKTDTTIEYDVIEYTETTTARDSPSAGMKKLPVSETNQQQQDVEIKKKRSLIDVIFDDWTDENLDDEDKDSSTKANDAVEDQLKSLLNEKTSFKSPEQKNQGSLSPTKPPGSNETSTQHQASERPESANLLLNDDDCEKSVVRREEDKKMAKRNDDSKELLAILEGDVEPDWSNLKSTLETSNGGSDNSKSIESKLDPLLERQIALKQLLELPMTTSDTTESSPRKPAIIEHVKFDETRSGRKRKPTEKAREHEIIAKRQKAVKSQPKKMNVTLNNDNSTVEKGDKELLSLDDSNKSSSDSRVNSLQKSTKEKKSVGQRLGCKSGPTVCSLKAPVPPIKRASKGTSATNTTEGTTPKPRKKMAKEIDRLLQDEGVVNLLYDVEQPRKRRLVPVTKSQVKVMDIQKVRRELKIRTKLVKNAVLRLRTSTTPGAKVPRAKRSSTSQMDQEPSQTRTPTQDSPNSKSSKSSDFLFPARIRNAADASIIIRRHSSSSFSSASGSPRVSFDSTERQFNLDEAKNPQHPAKINKRTVSQEEKKQKGVDNKKIKRPGDEIISQKSKGKTSIPGIKGIKNNDGNSPAKSNGTSSKITKPKKNVNKNSKVTFAKTTAENDNDSLHDELDMDEDEDELSACLAEAVTALANDSSNRAKNSSVNRKTKYKARDPTKVQFTNKEINVQRHGNLVQLIITPSTSSKIRNAITLPMMQELRDVLSILKKDDNCRVVLLTSTGSSFCEGLELSTLLEEDQDIRRRNAQLLANQVKDFIKSLATFNKPIVAGVQGSAVGLGVTMLPLFDLVIASDKASFSTPYGKLGQIAEGAAVFTLSHVLGSAVTSELLLGGRTLTANEALRAGLVTRVLWPDRFHVELLPSLRAMSEQSSQSMEATKALLRHSLRTKLAAALESESYLLVQHWCSNECQDAIRAYMDEKDLFGCNTS